jgi:hypothetical protein
MFDKKVTLTALVMIGLGLIVYFVIPISKRKIETAVCVTAPCGPFYDVKTMNELVKDGIYYHHNPVEVEN